MNQFQKSIKYVAMAFAIFLAVFIIGSIVSAAGIMLRIFNIGGNIIGGVNNKGGAIVEEEGTIESYENIEKIYIRHGVGSLIVQSGETEHVTVYVEGQDKNDYKIRTSGNTLNIEKQGQIFNFFNFNWDNDLNSRVVVTLPGDKILEDLDIDAGAGELLIEEFTSNKLSLDAGAGTVRINNVEAYEVDINGGAGEMVFSDVVFANSDISCGVGLVEFNGKLLNDNDISAGVGELNLRIHGKRDDYDVNIEKALGKIRIDGQEYGSYDIKQSNSQHTLNIDGGVGSINISFED